MKKYKAVIFDMDGTIVDTEKIWKKVNEVFFEKKNIKDKKFIKETINKIHGLSHKKICEVFKYEANISEPIEIIMNDISCIADQIFNEKISFISGFKKLHKFLRSKNIPTAIATNSSQTGLNRIDSALNLKKFFGDHMYSVTCVNDIGKPNPDIYLYAANQLGISPENCIAFEDSLHGVNAAKSAGMYCFAIDTSKLKNILLPADKIINKFSEVNFSDLILLN